MNRKIISAMCAGAIGIATFVTPLSASAAGGAAAAVSSATGKPGDTVTVNISLTENPGMTSMYFFLAYDKTVFELTSITDSKLWGGSTLFDQNINETPAILSWMDGTQNYDITGIAATAEFKIKDTAAGGDYNISLTTDPENVLVYNAATDNFDPVTLSLTSGKITIVADDDNKPGDDDNKPGEDDNKPGSEVTYTKVDANAATCTATGNVEYYKGSDNKLYTLANGVYTETTLAAVTTPMTDHDYGEDGVCKVCGTKKPADIEKPTVPTYYNVAFTGEYAGSGVMVTGNRTAGSVMTVRVPIGYTAQVYSGSNLIAYISDSTGTFIMPAANVTIKVTNDFIYMTGTGYKNAYIYSYDKDMKHIKTNSARGGMTSVEGIVTVKLGSDYAGKSVTLYSGRKSTENKLDEAVLDSNGRASFDVKSGKNYTLIVED